MRCHDVLHDTPAIFRSGYAWTYLFLVRYLPWLWEASYRLLDTAAVHRLVQPLRRRWNLAMARRFIRRLRQTPPDLVVTTHFLPADLCSAAKQAGWLRAPLVTVITDLHPHRFWLSREADVLVAATEESRAVCVARGIAPERVRVLGIPTGRAFHAPVDRGALRKRLGLDEGRLTVLVTSGGTTVGRFERVVMALLGLEATLPGRLQLLVVCGMDEGARRRLTERAERQAMPCQVFGFVEIMAELMSASDLIVAKAGGLTVSEALSCALPLVLYHIIPGQERMNAHYLAQRGAAVIAHRPADVAATVAHLAGQPEALQAMRRSGQAVSHPEAAEAIITEAVDPWLRQPVPG